jgi:hypothetical protein
MQKSVPADFRAATAHVVDIVPLQSDHVVRTSQVNAPVVVAIAGGGVGGHAVEVRIGNGYSVRGRCPQDKMLSPNACSLRIRKLASSIPSRYSPKD